MPHKIITTTFTKAWSHINGLNKRLEKAAVMTLGHLPKKLQFPITVSLLLTTDAAIRRLNRDFRGMDKATNVLSFPQYEPHELEKISRRMGGGIPSPLWGGLGRGALDKNNIQLSWRAPTPSPSHEGRGTHPPIEMGDIAIAYQYMVVEAKKDHKILIDHITHLFIHGLLHLFGYDHMLDPEAVRMERLETKIMAALDLPDPYGTEYGMEPKRSRKSAPKRSAGKRPRK